MTDPASTVPDPSTGPGDPSTDSKTKPAGPSAELQASSLELARAYAGREVVAVALVVVVGAFALSVMAFRDGTAVAAAMGAVTTLIGTLVGSYFGFQAGSEGRNTTAAAADTANKKAVLAAAFVPDSAHADFLPRLDQLLGTSPSDRPKEGQNG